MRDPQIKPSATQKKNEWRRSPCTSRGTLHGLDTERRRLEPLMQPLYFEMAGVQERARALWSCAEAAGFAQAGQLKAAVPT